MHSVLSYPLISLFWVFLSSVFSTSVQHFVISRQSRNMCVVDFKCFQSLQSVSSTPTYSFFFPMVTLSWSMRYRMSLIFCGCAFVYLDICSSLSLGSCRKSLSGLLWMELFGVLCRHSLINQIALFFMSLKNNLSQTDKNSLNVF